MAHRGGRKSHRRAHRTHAAHKGAMECSDRIFGDMNIERIKTGIPGFDELLGKGIPNGNSILVEGGPGSGKTIFCLNIAKNMCMKGKKVLYMSFEEPERRLICHMKDFGWDPVPEIKRGRLYIKRLSALDISRSVEALLSEAKKELLIEVRPMLFPDDFKPDILLVD